jgi:hypothetical protein
MADEIAQPHFAGVFLLASPPWLILLLLTVTSDTTILASEALSLFLFPAASYPFGLK